MVDIELLNLYNLTAWNPFEHLLPTGRRHHGGGE
ncbi:hypothetical protein J2S50_005376 [Streptomyces sp. DSM 40167]|nr:hypothetical protein [Streptomyces sp. HB132]MDQ0406827.1 hypothetical protein [Streptomyces sp. DSM 40167]